MIIMPGRARWVEPARREEEELIITVMGSA
jgi:hypothetical protein